MSKIAFRPSKKFWIKGRSKGLLLSKIVRSKKAKDNYIQSVRKVRGKDAIIRTVRKGNQIGIYTGLTRKAVRKTKKRMRKEKRNRNKYYW